MKMLGIMIVIIASWGYGSGLIYRLQQHHNQLQSMREMTDAFLGEIQYGKMPLLEVCQQISVQMQQPFRCVLQGIVKELADNRYESFQTVWRDQFSHQKNQFSFSIQEREVLYSIGKYLGYLDVEAQIRHLKRCQTQVDVYIEQLQKSMKEKKKVYRSVSLMVGVMVILLFL